MKNKNKNKNKNLSANTPASETKSHIYFVSFSVFLLFAFIFAVNNSKIASNDTFWILKMGEVMVQNKIIYTQEIFSATVLNKTYIAYQWLSQIIFYLMADINGINLSIFKLILMLLGSFFIGRFYFNKYKEGAWTYPILMVTSFQVAFRGELRSELFGTFFSAFLIYCIEKWRDSKLLKHFFLLIPAQIIWANTHGSFLLAPLLVLFYAGAMQAGIWTSTLKADKENPESFKSVLTLIGLSLALLLSSMVTPFGFDLIKKSATMFFSNSYMREHVREWFSIVQFSLESWYLLWILSLLFTLICFFRAKNKIVLRDLLSFFLALYFPFAGVRYVTISSLILMPIMLKYSHFIWPVGFRPKLQTIIFLPITLFILVFGYPTSFNQFRTPGLGFDYRVIPLDIHQHLKAHQYKGVLMNDYNDGAFFIYYNYPDIKTVMDSRTELYGESLFLDFQKSFTHYPFYQNFMTKYQADFAVTRTTNSVLRNFLFSDPNWVLEKTGLTHDLFRRKGSHETSYQYSILDHEVLNSQKRHCIFVRLLGRCHQAPDCEKECQYNDATIAYLLKLKDPICLKFSLSCQQPSSACSNCKDFCQHYQEEIGEINSRYFGADYKAAVTCR